MRTALLLLAALLAPASVPAQTAAPQKLPIVFRVNRADEALGQRLASGVRESLRRAGGVTLLPDDNGAWMWFDFTSVKGETHSVAYMVVAGVFDQGAWTGSSSWGGMVGYCGVQAVDECVKTIMEHIDQSVVDFQAAHARQRAERQDAPARQPKK